jgi:predicted TIM-barrel fold metal-dependent hydrolase
MDIVDTQVHANRMGPNWRTVDLATTVDVVVAAMDAVGVGATLIAEQASADLLRDPDPTATRLPNGALRFAHPFSELAVKLYPERFAYVARVDPLDPEAPALLAGLRGKPGALCTRIAPTLRPDQAAAFAGGGMDGFFAAAERHAVPVFLYLANRPEAVIPYAQRFPGLPLIVDHWGYPRPGSGDEVGADHFEAKVLALAALPNVFLKWCKGPRYISAEPYPHRDLGVYFRRSLDAFGPERIMWASDTTTSTGKTTWAEEVFHILDSDALSQGEKEQVFGRTARKVLRWTQAG